MKVSQKLTTKKKNNNDGKEPYTIITDLTNTVGKGIYFLIM